jgi:5-formyltetrahydrofolate cyclo-ligase
LEGSELWQKYSTVLAFLSMDDEINTQPLIQAAAAAHKRLFVPKIAGNDLAFYRLPADRGAADPAVMTGLHKGRFGIREPDADPALLLTPEDFPALVITPGLAFDRRGRRLGRGRGYYDRFFAALDSGLPVPGPCYTAVGLCMDCQLVAEVPAEPHDKTMDAVLTGKELIDIV